MKAPFLDLLNSDYLVWVQRPRAVDRLDDPEWVARFFDAWELRPPGDPRPGSAEVADLRSLRRVIRGLAEAASGGARPAAADVAALNTFLAGGPEILQLTARPDPAGYALSRTPAAPGWPAALARIAASMARVLAEGDPTRLRRCDNPDCRWWFYDRSRSRTRRWCDGRMCGNLMKVRRFRARRKPGGEDR